MSVVLTSVLLWLGYATAGVTVTAVAMWLLLQLCPLRSLAIQRFAWLLVLLPGVVVWRMSVVLPVLPTTLFSSLDVRLESEATGMLEADVSSPSMRGPSRGKSFSIASGGTSACLACAVVLGGWTAGMILLAARWAWSYLAFVTGLPRPLRPADEWVAELRDVCKELGLPRPIPLHVTQQLGPALYLGSGGYRLLVPQAAWGCCHELAHYVRGDLWKSLLAWLLAWPQWFNPLAWLAIRRFEEAAEYACDDAAVTAESADAFDYLRALLELGANNTATSTLQAAVRGGSLEHRVRRLLLPAGKDSMTKKLIVIAAAVTLAAAGFVRIQFASARSPAPENELVSIVPAKAEPARAPAVSLIANGSFEKLQEKSDDPEGWFGTRLPRTKGHYLLAVPTLLAHSGWRCAVVEIGDRHPASPVHYNWTTDATGWQAGETYELSGWIRAENVKRPAFIMAQCWSKDRTRMVGFTTTQLDYPITGTTDWIRVSTRLSVPEGTGVVRIRAGLSSQDNLGAKAWFDDLSLIAVAN
jgi:hypothetical protein